VNRTNKEDQKQQRAREEEGEIQQTRKQGNSVTGADCAAVTARCVRTLAFSFFAFPPSEAAAGAGLAAAAGVGAGADMVAKCRVL
jgi:hypothetical protein